MNPTDQKSQRRAAWIAYQSWLWVGGAFVVIPILGMVFIGPALGWRARPTGRAAVLEYGVPVLGLAIGVVVETAGLVRYLRRLKSVRKSDDRG